MKGLESWQGACVAKRENSPLELTERILQHGGFDPQQVLVPNEMFFLRGSIRWGLQIRGFLTNKEVQSLAEHTAAEVAAAVSQPPVVCLNHRDVTESNFYSERATSGHSQCLRNSGGAEALASRLSGSQSISIGTFAVGTDRRPRDGDVPEEAAAAAAESGVAAKGSQMDELLKEIESRVHQVCGLPPDHGTAHQLLSYSSNGSAYDRHTDCSSKENEPQAGDLVFGEKLSGERAFTTLGLLSDSFEGGATSFPLLGLELRVKAGDLLVWQNLARASTTSVRLETKVPVSPAGPLAGASPLDVMYRCDKELTHSSKELLSTNDGNAGKMAWQRWYSLREEAFLSERRPWLHALESRQPWQSILACDAVGSARELHLSTIPLHEPTFSCRLYGYWPYASGN